MQINRQIKFFTLELKQSYEIDTANNDRPINVSY